MPVYLPERYQRNTVDYAHEETDRILARMESEVHRIYRTAYSEMQAKADEYLKNFIKADSKKREQLVNGEITQAEYNQWRTSHILTSKRWYDMADTLAADMSNYNGIAASVINGHMPEVYALNYNYTAYQIEKQAKITTSFALYDRQTVERLIRDKPDLLPKAKVKIPKDKLWNRQKLNSAIMQGILQGETIPEIAKRLAKNVTGMNEVSAIRNARTMTTSAENGGRIDSYRRAESMGIKLVKEWSATLDGRTRHSHRRLDGETLDDIEAVFSNGCKFPGDPDGEPEEVYNCRCTLLSWVKGFEHTNEVKSSPKMGDMTYEQWKEAKPVYGKKEKKKGD